ncbi:hypothetical protein C8R44DRAFT_819137 [Mycena epipterygia]|nr:hypothetical protein C8R44DRAFT_819137 [Mycena epipterygia]
MGPPSKRGPTPFLTFFMEYRAQHPLPFAEAGRAAGQEWRALSDAAKQPYFAQSAVKTAASKAAYDKWMEAVDPAFLRRVNKARRAKNKSTFKKPVAPEDKRPLSAFFRFSRDFRNSRTLEGTPVEKALQVAAAYRALSATEKQAYATAAAGDRAAWKAEHAKA